MFSGDRSRQISMCNNGILVVGNAIVDLIKEVDTFPEQGNLATILSVKKDVGGNACNVPINLAIIDPDIPLSSAGFIGDDSNGELILSKLKEHHINVESIHKISSGHTSFTDVVVSSKEGQRTFFFHSGHGGELSLEFIRKIHTSRKIVQIGYLGALPKLEVMRNEARSFFSDALEHFQSQGCITAMDMVSSPVNENLRKIFFSCLPFLNFLIINEIEAGKILEEAVRDADGAIIQKVLENAASVFLNAGVSEAVVIHCPEQAFYLNKHKESFSAPSFHLDKAHIQSGLGAGDAFAAAFLYGIHQEYEPLLAIQLAHAAARFNLSAVSSTAGAKSLKELQDFITIQGGL